ncbi:vWA domain-containing protein, partial [Singulisphaera rosea]
LAGGGGSGIGSGGGIGRGVGPGTEFFGAREHARSFAYVIDCSGSMATRNSLGIAKRELLNSLSQLPPDAEFAVVFYNLNAKVFTDPQGHPGLMAATQTNKLRARVQLDEVDSIGGTDHMLALRAALAVNPEVIFFLTDADLMTNTDVDDILHESKNSRVQAVEFGRGADLGGTNPLRRLASSTGGTYRYLDVTKFPR